LLEVDALVRVLLALRLRAPQEVEVRDVRQVLAERAHFLLRAGTEAVEILGHLLRRADDVVLVAVVHVAHERRGRRRRLIASAALREGRSGKRETDHRGDKELVHHAADYTGFFFSISTSHQPKWTASM